MSLDLKYFPNMEAEHFSFETDILQPYCRELQARAFVTAGYFIDIGTPGDYERAQSEAVFTRFN